MDKTSVKNNRQLNASYAVECSYLAVGTSVRRHIVAYDIC